MLIIKSVGFKILKRKKESRMVKIILVSSMLGVLMFSGCSSDSKESLKLELKTLMQDCYSLKYSKDECKEKGEELGGRIKDFNSGASSEERINL